MPLNTKPTALQHLWVGSSGCDTSATSRTPCVTVCSSNCNTCRSRRTRIRAPLAAPPPASRTLCHSSSRHTQIHTRTHPNTRKNTHLLRQRPKHHIHCTTFAAGEGVYCIHTQTDTHAHTQTHAHVLTSCRSASSSVKAPLSTSINPALPRASSCTSAALCRYSRSSVCSRSAASEAATDARMQARERQWLPASRSALLAAPCSSSCCLRAAGQVRQKKNSKAVDWKLTF
jgi:hypothetical protein